MAYRNVLLSSKRAYSDIVQIQKSIGTSFDGWSPVIGLLQEQFGWTPKPIMHLLNFGYKSSAIFNITSVLPSTMVSLIQEIFCCLSFMLDQRDILLLDTSESKYNIQVHDAHRVSSTSFSLHDDSLWEKEKVLGLIQVEYDCDTFIRKHVSVNSRVEQLWNMNRAALLEKITNFDLPLPFCKLDWLCLLVFELEEYSSQVWNCNPRTCDPGMHQQPQDLHSRLPNLKGDKPPVASPNTPNKCKKDAGSSYKEYFVAVN